MPGYKRGSVTVLGETYTWKDSFAIFDYSDTGSAIIDFDNNRILVFLLNTDEPVHNLNIQVSLRTLEKNLSPFATKIPHSRWNWKSMLKYMWKTNLTVFNAVPLYNIFNMLMTKTIVEGAREGAWSGFIKFLVDENLTSYLTLFCIDPRLEDVLQFENKEIWSEIPVAHSLLLKDERIFQYLYASRTDYPLTKLVSNVPTLLCVKEFLDHSPTPAVLKLNFNLIVRKLYHNGMSIEQYSKLRISGDYSFTAAESELRGMKFEIVRRMVMFDYFPDSILTMIYSYIPWFGNIQLDYHQSLFLEETIAHTQTRRRLKHLETLVYELCKHK